MRTVEEFVRDALKKDRARTEVRSIALSTRWSSHLEEVLNEYDRQTQMTRRAA